MKTREAVCFLEEHRIKPSYPRLRIYQYLMSKKNHPTADTIFKDLSPEIPTLSRTTVYNTLNLFAEKGVVQMLTIEEKENKYDINTSGHSHFKCEVCGEITDIPFPGASIKLELPEGFQLREKQLYAYGSCPGCSSRQVPDREN